MPVRSRPVPEGVLSNAMSRPFILGNAKAEVLGQKQESLPDEDLWPFCTINK